MEKEIDINKEVKDKKDDKNKKDKKDPNEIDVEDLVNSLTDLIKSFRVNRI